MHLYTHGRDTLGLADTVCRSGIEHWTCHIKLPKQRFDVATDDLLSLLTSALSEIPLIKQFSIDKNNRSPDTLDIEGEDDEEPYSWTLVLIGASFNNANLLNLAVQSHLFVETHRQVGFLKQFDIKSPREVGACRVCKWL